MKKFLIFDFLVSPIYWERDSIPNFSMIKRDIKGVGNPVKKERPES